METFNKYKTIIVSTITALVIGGGWLYDRGSSEQKKANDIELLEGRIFESPQQMVRTVTTVEQLPSIAELEKQRLLDSIAGEAMKKNAEDAIRSRAARDKRDSLNAVTLYLMKEEIKQLKNNN